MTARMPRLPIGIASALLLFAALGAGYWWGRSRPSSTGESGVSGGAADAQRKVLYWYDPMVPQERYEKPGKSSMGMTLMPKYADDVNEGGIAIAPGARQNLGMRTAVVKLGSLAGSVRVPGTITWDLRQERVVSARVDSIVDRLYVRAPYEPVRAGQPLASVLAPMWTMALAEARALSQSRSAAARGLQAASRDRLRVLGLPPGAGAGPGGGGSITLSSPIDGVVSEIGVREGQSAPTGTLLFRVNGTRTVWLEAAVPQAGVTGIASGTPVEASVSAMPGRVFEGRVETLLPQLDAASRTQRARIVLDNPDGLLAPGMFAEITLTPVDGAEVPLVPSDALIGSGSRARVIVLGKNDTFQPVLVQPGRSSGGFTEILAGLKGGERVVISGQFLIDSEANLSGALDRLGAGTSAPAAEIDDAKSNSTPPEPRP